MHSISVDGDGVELAVHAWGDPARPTIVLVHGYPDDHRVWRGVIDALAERYHVVAYDVRGAGGSTAPAHAEGYRLEHLSRDLARVIDATSPGRAVHLVGHDWGAIQGWESATSPDRLGGRLRSFVSISGPCLDHVGHWIRDAAAAELVAQAARSWYIGAFQLPRLAERAWRGGLGRRWARVLARVEGVTAPDDDRTDDGVHGVGLYRANVRARLTRPRARVASVPVQVIVPTRDRFVDARLLDGLARWTPALWRREVAAGHWLPLSDPALLARWLAEWVELHEHGVETPALEQARVVVEEPAAPVARRVHFDWTDTPLAWVPGDPHTTHVADVLHLLLPAGERWFGRVLRQAAPLCDDEALQAALRGFIHQEGTHARAHAAVLEHMAAHGLDPTPFTRRIDWLFERVLADRRLRDPRRWLQLRVALIAAIEHLTSVLGSWMIEHDGLADAGADPRMLELLRWHAAEEVEHRAVAFDVGRAIGVGWAQRQVAMAVVFPVLFALWIAGTDFLMRADPSTGAARASWRRFRSAGRRGTLPTMRFLLRETARYLHPRFHPSQVGSTTRALALLAHWPTVRPAAG